MAEIKCYAFRISALETVRRRNEMVKDLTDLEKDKNSGYLGVCPSDKGSVLLFKTDKQRDLAFDKFKKIYVSAKIEKRCAYVDDKYLAPEYDYKADMKNQDPEFTAMMDELIKKECEGYKSECQAKIEQIKNEKNEIVQKLDIVEKENASLKYQVKELKEELERLRSKHSKELVELTNELKSAEAEMNRMEKCILRGGE